MSWLFWALSQTKTFYILQQVKFISFHIPEAWKNDPFRAEPPRIGHHREYIPPSLPEASLRRRQSKYQVLYL